MQKQNRNSQVHINGESGKTDFIIDPLLPIGKENAITTCISESQRNCKSGFRRRKMFKDSNRKKPI